MNKQCLKCKWFEQCKENKNVVFDCWKYTPSNQKLNLATPDLETMEKLGK